MCRRYINIEKFTKTKTTFTRSIPAPAATTQEIIPIKPGHTLNTGNNPPPSPPSPLRDFHSFWHRAVQPLLRRARWVVWTSHISTETLETSVEDLSEKALPQSRLSFAKGGKTTHHTPSWDAPLIHNIVLLGPHAPYHTAAIIATTAVILTSARTTSSK